MDILAFINDTRCSIFMDILAFIQRHQMQYIYRHTCFHSTTPDVVYLWTYLLSFNDIKAVNQLPNILSSNNIKSYMSTTEYSFIQ